MTRERKKRMSKERDSAPFRSALPNGWQRFLAHVVEHGLTSGRRTPEDFIRHFPPARIMYGLDDEPSRRASILVRCTGVRDKIALKKSTESCAGDLQIALDENETDAESIVELFEPDDRVLYLEKTDLWQYVSEGEFWAGDGSAIARAHIAYILERALVDELLSHRDIVHGVTTERLAELLPRAELGVILAGALLAAQDGQTFGEKDLLETVTIEALVEAIPLTEIWNDVIVALIAEPHGFTEGAGPSSRAQSGQAVPEAASHEEDAEGGGDDEEGDDEEGDDENGDDGDEDDEDDDDDDDDLDMDIDDALDMAADGKKRGKTSR